MTQHGDHIMRWAALIGGLLLFAIIAVFTAIIVAERRRDRQREAEAAMVLTAPLSTVAERTMLQIARDSAADEDCAEAEPYANLESWLADVGSYRRHDLETLSEDMTPVYELAYEGLEDPTVRAHDFAELVEMMERPLAVAVEATETREWPQAWQDELDALLYEGATA